MEEITDWCGSWLGALTVALTVSQHPVQIWVIVTCCVIAAAAVMINSNLDGGQLHIAQLVTL